MLAQKYRYNKMEGKMEDIEMKKMGLQKAIYSLLVEWKDLQALLDFSSKTPFGKMVQNEKCVSPIPMREKRKEIDLNEGSCVDLAEVLDFERNKMMKMVGNHEGLCDEKLREIEVKMREMEFSRDFIEERAKELELREKEIDKGFNDLKVKKMEFARKSTERAKELESREKAIDDGYKDLKVKKMEFAKITTGAKELESRQKEIDDVFKDLKVKKMEFAKKSAERAKEFELREKEITDGFRDLEVKKMEFAEKSDAKLVEIEEQKLKLKERWEILNSREKEVERVKVICEQRFEEIVDKVREVDSSKKYIEEYVKELGLKRKELDNGFKELESKKMEFTQKTNKFAAINFSNADISMTLTKRQRSSYDLRSRAPARTELAAPRVNQTVINKNSEGEETFWTCCTYCKFKFKYHKIFVNNILKCRTCSKNFTAYELDPESIPPESNVQSVKRIEFSAKTDKIAGINSSHADVNMNQMKTKGYTSAEGKSLYGSDETIKQQVNLLTVVTLDPDSRAANGINDSETDQNQVSHPTAVSVDCPYPEFSDFDKDKDEKCFSVDQIWACYDSLDVMPILYGHVRKVFSPDFKLQVTFLKANPEEQNKINWVKAGLPMVCGKFIHDDTVEISKRLSFSHQIRFEKGSEDGTYLIYPRKGETWGMFKDWNIGWSSDPANHKTFKYLMVEILSDFKPNTGVEICYLTKVKGFVSVFRRTAKDGNVAFLVPSSEMLRFSHSVPSTKLTGAEREGVPAGAFELDPACLPVDPNKLCQPE